MINWTNLDRKLITAAKGNDDTINRYFTEIRSYEALTKEEEKELIIVIQAKKEGHTKALDKLIKANLKFVVSVAKQYQGQGSSLMDLISEGNGGLCHAVKFFDTSKDLKFFSYAVWWIRLQMFKNLYNDSRTIRLPDNRALLVTRIKREVSELEQKLERYPSLEELVEFINTKDNTSKFTKEDLYEAILHGGSERSIQDLIKDSDNEDRYFEEILEGDINLKIDDIDKSASLSFDLTTFFYQLNQTEFDVLCLFMGLNGETILKSADIAKALGIKEKEVVKLRTRAVKRLKKLKNIELLKDYL